MKNSPKKTEKKLQSARDAFDYMVKMSFEKIKAGGKIESEFVAIVYMPNETTFSVIPVPLGETYDAAQRREVMRVVGEDLADQGAVPYVFIALSEVWIGTLAKDGRSTRPSEDPKKKEGIIASAQDKSGYVRNISYQIKRKQSGVVFSRINLFGSSQVKQAYEWTKPSESKIENSLTIEAWKAYKFRKKQK